MNVGDTKKILTLVMITKNEQVLLGMKKRGFGAGLWNGFGGKVEEGETLEEAAVRELKEEVNLTTTSIRKRGVLHFSYASDTPSLEVHVFAATDYHGEPVETEEMKPEWFAYTDIPYGKMWPDDAFWLPLFLEGKYFEGRFHFDAPVSDTHSATIISHSVNER